jgi:SAM-dependent methyltransferase
MFTPPDNEAGWSYWKRRSSGFIDKYCSGPVILDVGYSGGDGNDAPGLPHAVGVDLGYPGYDGVHLPFEDGTVDTVFSSHCLEHITNWLGTIMDWHRVLRIGGFIVCVVPHQYLYERRLSLPSRFNPDHKRFYTPSSLLAQFESALTPNSYRVRHLSDNDANFDYSRGPDLPPTGRYEIECVVEKIKTPSWSMS